MLTTFWFENLSGRDRLEGVGVWEDNTEMGLRKIGMKGVDWIHLILDKD
jgi:hypothetical protein